MAAIPSHLCLFVVLLRFTCEGWRERAKAGLASRRVRDAGGRRVRRDRDGDGTEGGHHVGPPFHTRNEGVAPFWACLRTAAAAAAAVVRALLKKFVPDTICDSFVRYASRQYEGNGNMFAVRIFPGMMETPLPRR